MTHVNVFSYFFGRNVTDKVNSQKTLYYATSNDLCFCTTWQNRQTQKLHFHSNAVLLHCQNSTSCCLISSTFLVILTLLYDSLNPVIDAFSSGLLGGMVQEKRSRECCSNCTVLHAHGTSALSSGFPLLQGNAETLNSQGSKTKHCLISYTFFFNTSATTYHNRIVYVKIIAIQRTFF